MHFQITAYKILNLFELFEYNDFGYGNNYIIVVYIIVYYNYMYILN